MGRFLSVRKTLEVCRGLGWLIGKVETPGRMFSHGFVTPTDLFGFADLVAILPGEKGVLFIQATAGSHVSDHLDKMLDNEEISPNVKAALESENQIELWCWVVRSPKGTKRKTRDAIRWKFSLNKEGVIQADRIDDYSVLRRSFLDQHIAWREGRR